MSLVGLEGAELVVDGVVIGRMGVVATGHGSAG